MTDPETPVIPRDTLLQLLDFEQEEAPVICDRETLQMSSKRLEQLLRPERTTANLVVLLDKRKHRLPRAPLVLACCMAAVAVGAAVASLAF
jgi:hypothetical protein